MALKEEKKKQRFKEKNDLDQENLIIKDEIKKILKNQKPRDIRTLVTSLVSESKFSKEKIISAIKELEYNNEIILKEPYDVWTTVHEIQHVVNKIVGSKFRGSSPEAQMVKGAKAKSEDY